MVPLRLRGVNLVARQRITAKMKIILIILCILNFPGVVDVVEAADNHLRGSNRDLQLFDFGGGGFFGQSGSGSVGGNNLVTLTPTNPNQPSLPFEFSRQPAIPSQTPNNIAPVFGNDNPNFLGFLQPMEPAETTDPPADNPFGFDFGGTIMFDPPGDQSTGIGGSAGCPSLASGVACNKIFRPVNCPGGCRYNNNCLALGAGFAENQCRPD
jgi:hypothetical protein